MNQDVILFLKRVGVPDNVIKHSMAVAKYAEAFAVDLLKKGVHVDVNKVGIGALLHDIGRSKTHTIAHGVVGGEILRHSKFKDYARFAETHIGAGISRQEAIGLGLGNKEYIPSTLEEKIVAYIDDRVFEDRLVSEEEALEKFKTRLSESPALNRIKQLFSEMRALCGKEWSYEEHTGS